MKTTDLHTWTNDRLATVKANLHQSISARAAMRLKRFGATHGDLDFSDLDAADQESTRLIRLIEAEQDRREQTQHTTCEDCGQPAEWTWHSGPASNGGVEVAFGQCHEHALSGSQPGIDNGYLTRNNI